MEKHKSQRKSQTFNYIQMKMSAYFKYKLTGRQRIHWGKTNQWGKADHHIRKWITEENRIDRTVMKDKSKCAVSK